MVDRHKKIDLVIPCAGIGSRLGYLTKNITKNMVKINGYSILEHQLSKFYLYTKQINKVYFILGYKSKILKSYISKLNLPFVTKFYTNKNYKNTACAYSLSLILNHLQNDTVFINSDLVLNQKKIDHILEKKINNFVYLRKSRPDYKSRPVKAQIYKNKIVKIDFDDKNFNLDVVGPFKLSLNAITILKKICKLTDKKKLKKLSCYIFFGRLLTHIKLDYSFIKDSDWHEINTIDDYKKSLNNKFFQTKLNVEVKEK
jgi:choline kinase